MGTKYKMSIKQQLPSIFLKCISIRNLLYTPSLSEPQPWLGFWSRKLAPYSNASLRETFLLLIFELKRKIYCRRLQISLRCTEKFERFISWDSSSEMRQRLNIQIELVMRRHPYKTTVAKYLRKAGEKISFQRRKDQKMTQNFMFQIGIKFCIFLLVQSWLRIQDPL